MQAHYHILECNSAHTKQMNGVSVTPFVIVARTACLKPSHLCDNNKNITVFSIARQHIEEICYQSLFRAGKKVSYSSQNTVCPYLPNIVTTIHDTMYNLVHYSS